MEVNTRFATANVFIHSACNYIHDNPINYLNVRQIHRNYITFRSLTSSTLLHRDHDAFDSIPESLISAFFLSLSFSHPPALFSTAKHESLEYPPIPKRRRFPFHSFTPVAGFRGPNRGQRGLELESAHAVYMRFADQSPRIRGTEPQTWSMRHNAAALDLRF